MAGLSNLFIGDYRPPTKRNVFFSFHYADIMRVNNVRMSGQFKTPETPNSNRSIEGFYDKGLWESKKISGPDALKELIRAGVINTSVVCLLVGSQTFARRWVRYEIARSIIDGKGLMVLHINSINHHQPPYQPHDRGPNPAFYMGIARKENGNYYICERKCENNHWKWVWYADYVSPVSVPKYMPAPTLGTPTRLSAYTQVYEWGQGSYRYIGNWLDMAAQAAGR